MSMDELVALKREVRRPQPRAQPGRKRGRSDEFERQRARGALIAKRPGVKSVPVAENSSTREQRAQVRLARPEARRRAPHGRSDARPESKRRASESSGRAASPAEVRSKARQPRAEAQRGRSRSGQRGKLTRAMGEGFAPFADMRMTFRPSSNQVQ